MANHHADCEHESTQAARDKGTRARRKEACTQRHPGRSGAQEVALEAVATEHPVTTIKVHSGIWSTAMELAGGDRSKIRVLSPTRVEVTA